VNQKQSPDLKKISTHELVNELAGREAVERFDIKPYEKYSLSTEVENLSETGPAVVLVITD
jgi:hypothetical protein